MKKILATTLAVVLVFSMAACGSKKESNENTESNVVTSETVTSETAASETITSEILVTTEQTTEGEEAGEAGALGTALLEDFKGQVEADAALTAQAIAEKLITNPVILFSPAVAPVEAGFLMGFDAEISGFEEAVMFAPMIGTIPFVGYVFTLAEGADTEAFVKTLSDNANPRWNICTEAEDTVIEAVGNKVFFLMCPKSLEG